MTAKPNTTAVVIQVSWRVGQNTLRSSLRASTTNCLKSRPSADNAKHQRAQAHARGHCQPAHPRRLVAQHVEGDDARQCECNCHPQQESAAARLLFPNLFVHHRYSLAGQEGIEPPTCGFGDRRSAN